MLCLDWEKIGADMNIYGAWTSLSQQYISIILTTCNYQLEGYEDASPIPDECEADEQA